MQSAWHRDIPEYPRISQNIPEYPGALASMFLCALRLPSFAPRPRELRGSRNQLTAGREEKRALPLNRSPTDRQTRFIQFESVRYLVPLPSSIFRPQAHLRISCFTFSCTSSTRAGRLRFPTVPATDVRRQGLTLPSQAASGTLPASGRRPRIGSARWRPCRRSS